MVAELKLRTIISSLLTLEKVGEFLKYNLSWIKKKRRKKPDI